MYERVFSRRILSSILYDQTKTLQNGVEIYKNTSLVSNTLSTMPNYDYHCLTCGAIEERLVTIAKKDEPIPCSCGKGKKLQRMVANPSISYDTINPIRRAGSGWNDVLQRIEKNSGKNNIEHY
tara:strand:- start:9218 stop:9586 length:369 start_codon:yes stop_codon:yes gene_type:complete